MLKFKNRKDSIVVSSGVVFGENKERILDLLFESVDQHGATLLAVTHDHDLLPRFDRVVDFHDFRQGQPA